MKVINKSLEDIDLEELDIKPIVQYMKKIISEMEEEGLKVTTRGRFFNPKKVETLHPPRCWEYSRQIEFSGVKSCNIILDCGGSSTPLVFYLADLGCQVYTIELNKELVDNTNEVAEKKGWLNLQAEVMDMTAMRYADNMFDVVFSTSVLEHMPKEKMKDAMREMARVLNSGGVLALTFDYGKPVNASHHPLSSLDEIREILIKPSGLEIFGNDLVENRDEIGKFGDGKYTMYSLFLKKSSKNALKSQEQETSNRDHISKGVELQNKKSENTEIQKRHRIIHHFKKMIFYGKRILTNQISSN